MNYLTTGNAPKRLGNAHPNIVPYQDFPTADGYMILAIGNDGQFAKFCAVAGAPELAGDERYATNKARVTNRAELVPQLQALTRQRTTAEWIAVLEAAAVPCGPINSVAQAFEDPQVRARGMRVEMDHPQAGTVALAGSPIRMSGSPVSYRLPPPGVGTQTDEVLGELLGLDHQRLAELRAQGIV
jgi:crotonobetainyl-CoA:carnitine CoA-transferase CaiB-like acyl-CoA transferase